MSCHTNATQAERFWPHAEKFNGLNGNIIAFLGEIIKEMKNQKKKLRENSRQYKIVERSTKYIDFIYSLTLSSKKKKSRIVNKFKNFEK